MFEKIRQKLSEALDALGGDEPVSREELDRVLGQMRRELIDARAELRERRERVEEYERRLEALRDRPDVDPADLAEIEAEVERRRSELAEHRQVVGDLTEQFKDAVKRRDVLPARDRRARASETLREAGEEGVRDFERVEEEIEGEARRAEARREVEDALDPDAELERLVNREDFRDTEADELLDELKRRMGMDREGEE